MMFCCDDCLSICRDTGCVLLTHTPMQCDDSHPQLVKLSKFSDAVKSFMDCDNLPDSVSTLHNIDVSSDRVFTLKRLS